MDPVAESAPAARLPADILAIIFDVAHSSLDILHLAQTCKAIYRQLQPSFRRHRHAHHTFRHASDRDPRALMELVRQLVIRCDPVVAKYVRSFDVWGARLSWPEWRNINVDPSDGITFADEEAASDRFSPDEISRLLAIASDVVGESESEAARNELENGHDGLLKLLIIASAPRLECLKFIRRQDPRHKSGRAWLYKAICHQTQTEAVASEATSPSQHHWPPGMTALRSLAVGIDTGLAEDHDDVAVAEVWEVDAELPMLMRLPYLCSLYYRIPFFSDDMGPLWGWDELDWHDPDNGYEPYENLYRNHLPADTPPGSSAVTELYLEDFRGNCTGDEDLYVKLLAMPRALESFAARFNQGEFGEGVSAGDFLDSLGNHQKHSLRRMMFYSPWNIRGYRCRAYLPEDIPDAPLTMYWQSAADMGLMASHINRTTDRAALVTTFEECLDREALEVLLLDDVIEGWCIDDASMTVSYYEDALVAVLQLLGEKNLKALFISLPGSPDVDAVTGTPNGFTRVLEMAEKHNIDLYGSEHFKAKKQHVLNFPTAPSKWDIGSGPDYGKRIEQGFTLWDVEEDVYKLSNSKDVYWGYEPPKKTS